ncbi:MAG: DUF305 domain-containing protein [Nocardioidaceae bacterium]|nr:DUF305 domain-containing protein [Nocardioidaceae bacterium]
MRRFVIAVIVLAAAAGALAACGTTGRADAPTRTRTVDDTFVAQMAQHDADARQLARLARDRSDDDVVLDSADVAGDPGWDHQSMRAWMGRHGDGGSMMGTDGPGEPMMGRSDGPGMDALRTCPGEEFDGLWDQTMRTHLDAVIDDSAVERATGSDASVRAWAEVVDTDARRQLETMPTTTGGRP